MRFFELYNFVCSYEINDFYQVEGELVNRKIKLRTKIGLI